jgi:hypothetical protein
VGLLIPDRPPPAPLRTAAEQAEAVRAAKARTEKQRTERLQRELARIASEINAAGDQGLYRAKVYSKGFVVEILDALKAAGYSTHRYGGQITVEWAPVEPAPDLPL